MKPARLQIWINKRTILQGKIYKLGNRWVYLANIDDKKLWTKFNGYSIATQILETFSKAKIRPLILYKYADRGYVLMATPSTFYKYGIPTAFGGHRQIILPVNKWKFFKEALCEPFGLPKKTVDEWIKPEDKHIEDFSIPVNVWERLRPMLVQKGLI